jgi:glycosyltransferase involved in cell wall biosynthesis
MFLVFSIIYFHLRLFFNQSVSISVYLRFQSYFSGRVDTWEGMDMRKLENEDIVCISSVDWEPLWTRKQQVMSRLPRSNRILYVEPPISLLSPFKDPACWVKWKMWRQGLRKLNENIWLLSPPVTLPLGNIYPVINRINQWFIARSVRKAMRKLGFQQPILWTYLHNSAHLVGRLGEKLVVYDCVDEHSAYQGFNPQAVKAMERELLEQSDLVFVTAQGLYEDKQQWCREIYLSPNAADVEHFMQADNPATPLADEMKNLPGPVLGFVGAIKEWIDLELIRFVAAHRPEWTVVMVGPLGVEVDISALEALPNVHFLGGKPREELPCYLKGFDVCLNPFRQSELTRTVSPLKFYEYLASGRPIASVPMPEIMEFGDVVEFGEGAEGFLTAVERALADTAEKKAQRLARARENSWDSRVEYVMDKVAAKIASQPQIRQAD